MLTVVEVTSTKFGENRSTHVGVIRVTEEERRKKKERKKEETGQKQNPDAASVRVIIPHIIQNGSAHYGRVI